MKPIPVLGIPHYNRPDLLDRCVASIDYPVDKLVIVQNGKNSDFPHDLLWAHKNVAKEIIHIKHPNAGVAGSWNEIIMLFPSPWWMLVNNDIQFTPGDLEKMAGASWEGHEKYAALFGNHGHSFFAVTKRGIRNVGVYDPNLRPAYFEDNDWMWRCKCVGETTIDVPGVNAIHGEQVRGHMEGSRTINASPQLANENARTFDNNYRYYVAKTGGPPGQEKFLHPFNNPELRWNYLSYDPDICERQQWSI
jgi:glycosyltransferase involved in cell wall biosynthesis